MTGEDGPRPRVSRRQVLATTASVAGVGGLAGCSTGSGGDDPTPTPTSEFANYPPASDTVRLGVSIPETGPYSGEGAELLAGYQLAVETLAGGDGAPDPVGFDGLSTGILEREPELVVANTASTGDGADAAATGLVEDDGVIALFGGATGDAVRAHQAVADRHKVLHMAGFSPDTAIGGEHCSRYGFGEGPNARMVAGALRPTLTAEIDDNARFAQVYPDSPVGRSLSHELERELTGEANWFSLTAEPTKVGTDTFAGPIRTALDRDPDVLVLNYYGLAGASALRQASRLAPADVALVVPVLTRPTARNAGAALEGVIGTVAWDAAIRTPASASFTWAWQRSAVGERVGTTHPSGLAHLAYVQLLGYAAAVERAGTFEPPPVVDELEGHSYDVGLGSQELRSCDHQATRPVPVVRGLPEAAQRDSRYVDLLGIATESVLYSCDESPAADCSI